MWPLIVAAGIQAGTGLLKGRSAQKAAQAASNIQAGQAGENAALSRDLPYRLNPYLQQSAEQWGQNVRGVYDEAGNLVMDTAGNAAAGVRGAATQANQYLDPYYQTGTEANRGLYELAMSRLNAPEEEFAFSENDPSYQWRLQQGQRAVERSAAARGGLNSGATLKSLTGYGQGLASQEYAAEHARWLAGRAANRADTALWIDPLTGVASRGLTAGTQMGENLLTGEKYAGDWTTQGARTAGDFRGKGATFQSDMMNNSTEQQIRNIFAGESAGMNYMTDRAAALAGGQVASANAKNATLSSMVDPFTDLLYSWKPKTTDTGWGNQGRIPGMGPEYSIPGTPRRR